MTNFEWLKKINDLDYAATILSQHKNLRLWLSMPHIENKEHIICPVCGVNILGHPSICPMCSHLLNLGGENDERRNQEEN